MNINNQNFTGTNLRFLRESFNIRPAKMARDLKIDQSTLTKWENLQRNITIDWAIKISNYFQIAVGDFITTDLRNEPTKFSTIINQNNKDNQ